MHNGSSSSSCMTGYQKKNKRQAKKDLAVNIIVTIYCKRSQLERGGGTSSWSCTLAKPAAHCLEKRMEEL